MTEMNNLKNKHITIMRSILIAGPLPPPVHGAAQVNQYIKDSKLMNGRFDMDFVNLATSRKVEEISKCGPLLSVKKMWRFMCSFLRCLWLLATHRYDLCYLAITCHGTGLLKDVPFVLLCKAFGRKIVIHQHNKGMNNDTDRWPYRWLLPLTYRNCKVILLSWRLYPDIEKVVRKENVMICPNGIPPLEDVCAEGKEERLLNAVPRLLFLSNLIVSKGVYVMLDACRMLNDRGIAFACDFVGNESMEISRPEFEKEIHNRGLDDMVRYHGPKYGRDKEEYWNSADVFVFPTYNDCFPLVLLEAMQHSLPVVATDEGGIPDIVQDGISGLICRKNDAKELADKVETMLADKELRVQMGRNGCQRVKSDYTIGKWEEKLCECLTQIGH